MCDDIIITGISGKFPGASNVQEFSEKLFNKVYLVSESAKRFNFELSDYPKYTGLVENLDKFDSALHGSQKMQIKLCDPQTRLLTEVTCEAMFDSGYSPEEFKNSNTGMYVGCTTFDSRLYWHTQDSSTGSARMLNSPYTIPNKISYALGLRGPSMLIDTACSSSFYALNAAVDDLKSGKCDAAIVASPNVIFYPLGSVELIKAGMLTRDGISQPFDKNVSGYIRADAFCALILQKLPDARRNYASILNIKTANDGFKIEGATVPSKSEVNRLITKTYEEVDISPSEVNFIESHASSTVVGDKILVDTFDETFCKNRTHPLKIGSVKCNTGHTEGASGLVSLVKALMMFENEKIIPNINITELRDDCDAFNSGRIEVPIEVEPFHDDLIGVDNFGILGANSHCIIKRNPKTKTKRKSNRNLPRLVLWAGRTLESVDYVFKNLLQNPFDDEFIALLQKSQAVPHSISTYRGFAIFDTNEIDEDVRCLDKHVIDMNVRDQRPIVFVYSGVGSQWLGMGRDLMKIPLIKDTIDECHQVLESKNVNLKNVLTSEDPHTFDACLNIFIGVVAIQIALTRLLKKVGINADFFVGHSAGEVACAFSDDALSLEVAMLTAYIRGKAVMEKCQNTGGMAAVAMNYEALQKLLSKDIEIACYNSVNSFTVTGDMTKVENFANQVKASGHLAKVIDSSGIAFHSSRMEECGEHMKKMLSDVIQHPKSRSSKWISTSSSFESANELIDADYFKNNLTNAVKFSHAIDKIPHNSLIIEVAPHSIMQGILMKNAPKTRAFVGLTQRDSHDGSIHLLKSLGKIFQNGVNMDISEIYPKIEFPVSRGTQMIAPLIKWDHSESHFVPYFNPSSRFCHRNLSINLYLPEYADYSDHVIDGQIILPTSGYIELLWETFAMMHGQDYQNFSVRLENLEFVRAVVLTPKTDCNITVNIRKATGMFEVCEDDDLVASGKISRIDNGTLSQMQIESIDDSEFVISHSDFYKKILRLRGYQFLDNLKLVRKIGGFSTGKLYGQIEWRSQWAAFIDSLLHLYMADFKNRDLLLPTKIAYVTIDTESHWRKINHDNLEVVKENGATYLNTEYNIAREIYSCGGVQLRGVEFKAATRRKPAANLRKEIYKFCPHFPTPELSLQSAVKFAAQIFTGKTGRFFEQILVEVDCGSGVIINEFADIASDWGQAVQKCFFITNDDDVAADDTAIVKSFNMITTKACVIIVHESSGDDIMNYVEKLEDKGMIIWRHDPKSNRKHTSDDLLLLAQVTLKNEIWDLYLKYITPGDELTEKNVLVVPTDPWKFDWVEELKERIASDEVKIVCGRSSGSEYSGVDGLAKCMIQDYHYMNIRSVFINDDSAPEFDVTNPFYADQLKLRINFNVYQDGSWGSYRHLDMPEQMKSSLPDEHHFVNVKTPGDLRSVQWYSGDLNTAEEDVVEVHYASLNLKDIQIASKQISPSSENFIENQFNCGLEFSGIDKSGRKIMGIVKNRAMSNCVKIDEELTLLANDSWSLEDASTIPYSYMTIYAAFFVHSNIKAGQSIWIHLVPSGLGQAAIRTAINYGLKVFATVDTLASKKVLLDIFTELTDDQIGYGVDTSDFEDMIMKQNNGNEVDYVLKVEPFDIQNGTIISMEHFAKRHNLKTVKLSHDCVQQLSEEEKTFLANQIQHDISTGKIKPLTRSVFDARDVQKAFKSFDSLRSVGKVLIKIRNSDRSMLPVEVHPRVSFNAEKSYIVTGGLGGMGVELCDWMVTRGCSKLVLSSRRGIANSYQEYKVRLWKSYGAQVEISTADIITKSGCEKLVEAAARLGPVGGVFSLAAVLYNDFFEVITPQQFYNVFMAKVHAVMFLDEITRQSCPYLDHFLVFSSVASGRGAVKQTNYAMANSITERIAERRRHDGFAGKAIQWGPISGVGMLGDFHKDSFSGYAMQPVASCIELMDDFLTSTETVLSSIQFPAKKMTVKTETKESAFDSYVKYVGLNLKNVDENCIMSDIGVDSLIATEFRLVLCRDYQIKLTMNEIRSKKVCEIREMFSKPVTK